MNKRCERLILQFCRPLQGLCRGSSPCAARDFAGFAGFPVFTLHTCARELARETFSTLSHVYRYVVQNCKNAKPVARHALRLISEAAKPAKRCKMAWGPV